MASKAAYKSVKQVCINFIDFLTIFWWFGRVRNRFGRR